MHCVIKQRRSIRKRDTIRSEQQRRVDLIRTGTGWVNLESKSEVERDFMPKVKVNELQKCNVGCIHGLFFYYDGDISYKSKYNKIIWKHSFSSQQTIACLYRKAVTWIVPMQAVLRRPLNHVSIMRI